MFKNPEIKQISEKEIWVGNNRTTLIEKNIIYVIPIGDVHTETAIAQSEINNKLSELVDGTVNYLIDLNKTGKNSPEARKIWAQIGDNKNTCRVAFFGLNPVARVLANFSMGIGKKITSVFLKQKKNR